MNAALLDRIVKAVLYEGYMLYPYRPSAVKNRQRFNFGVIYPRDYAESQRSGDSCAMQTECLLQGDAKTEGVVRVRFLRLVTRSVLKRSSFSAALEPVERLDVDGQAYQSWQEAAEETIEVTEFDLYSLPARRIDWPFRLSPWRKEEPIRDKAGELVGILRWDEKTVAGKLELTAERLRDKLFKLRVRITNDSQLVAGVSREAALDQSLVSAHTILELRGGEFLSLTDPPEAHRDLARSCQNVGTWPILVGMPGETDVLLSSPIILSDYPEVAPESPGDLFDGAEIDEILSLRILTMTDEEKREMRESDARGRQILERTESLPEEQWMKLHGAFRGLRARKEDTP
jgi:hypothetical protein